MDKGTLAKLVTRGVFALRESAGVVKRRTAKAPSTAAVTPPPRSAAERGPLRRRGLNELRAGAESVIARALACVPVSARARASTWALAVSKRLAGSRWHARANQESNPGPSVLPRRDGVGIG